MNTNFFKKSNVSFISIIKGIVIIILFSNEVFSQNQSTINQIVGSAYTEIQSYDFLQRLCDEAGGRLAGSPENEKGIAILTEELNKIGISPKLEKFSMNSWKRGDDLVEVITPINKKLRVMLLLFTENSEFTSSLYS